MRQLNHAHMAAALELHQKACSDCPSPVKAGRSRRFCRSSRLYMVYKALVQDILAPLSASTACAGNTQARSGISLGKPRAQACVLSFSAVPGLRCRPAAFTAYRPRPAPPSAFCLSCCGADRYLAAGSFSSSPQRSLHILQLIPL